MERNTPLRKRIIKKNTLCCVYQRCGHNAPILKNSSRVTIMHIINM